MRSLLGALTVRGRSFVAAGVAAIGCGLLIPEPDLLRLGVLLAVLPLLSAFAAGRARYRLACTRRADPARVQAGQPSSLTIRLANVSRLRTGLLLAEDSLPYALGSRPRFVLDGLRAGGTRSLTYQVRSEARGKYTVGPLQVRVADAFGLISITRSFSSASTLTVTPRIIPLTRPRTGGNWLGDSEQGRRSIAAAGEDDVATRPYQTGDGLNRVHWRSTARYGALMVRREEQHWRDTASLFLDTRRAAYWSASAFELAVTAMASIGVHLSGEGRDARLITDSGEVPRAGSFRDTLLDTLAVVRQSRATGLAAGIEALAAADGQVIAVLGTPSASDARQLAAARRGAAPAMALLVGCDEERPAAMPAHAAAEILSGAGWQVAAVPDGARLAAAWRDLHRAGSGRGGYGTAGYGTAGRNGTSREAAGDAE
jgi:uncharacterized protein (DUF58 family)